MNRVGRRNLLLNHDDDDGDEEEKLYERQALISDEEINDNNNDATNQFIVRHRSQTDKRGLPYANGHELKDLTRGKDPLNDPIQPIEFTNYDIQPGDTLQNICLRYACPVNQVKRLNGLINDQEFYALRVLKLPVGKMGLLDELLKQQQQPTNGNGDLLDNRDVLEHSNTPTTSRKTFNSPGSALSISVRQPTSSNFIKSEIDENHITVDNLLTDSDPVVQNVFEDLDYHVEMAKAATETQDQRVTELVDTIAINNPSNGTNVVRPAKRVSKIPELFFSGENFGLNIKRLIFLIIFVCLVVPLVYINQTSHVVSHNYSDKTNHFREDKSISHIPSSNKLTDHS